jgi:hypothetical protein
VCVELYIQISMRLHVAELNYIHSSMVLQSSGEPWPIFMFRNLIYGE